MAELPRQSSRWRRGERLVLIACVVFAAFEIGVLVALEVVVAGAWT